MIDIKRIRETPDLVKKAADEKKVRVDIDQILSLDQRRREIETEFNDLRHEQRQAGEKMAKASKEEKATLGKSLKEVKARLQALDGERETVESQLNELMLLVPQIPHPDAPRGPDESGNVEVRKHGTPKLKTDFGFEFKDHLDLGNALGMFDIERGVKIAGSRNYVLTGLGARLHEAVLRLAWDLMAERKIPAVPEGEETEFKTDSTQHVDPKHQFRPAHFYQFQPLTVPALVSDKLMYGTGFFPLHQEEVYRCERDDQSLVGTSEVPVTGFHMDEILSDADLPKLYFARSTCFRREAGAAGKDTRGLYRIHFFDKIEQVVICKADAAESAKWHEQIIANAEALLQALELPYRLVEVCRGDMGQGKFRMFDIETWMPSREAYSETHSASSFHDFQARRLGLRYRNSETGKPEFCHTLNNTVVASPRILIPLMEMHQNEDGSITVPQALRPHLGGMERIQN